MVGAAIAAVLLAVASLIWRPEGARRPTTSHTAFAAPADTSSVEPAMTTPPPAVTTTPAATATRAVRASTTRVTSAAPARTSSAPLVAPTSTGPQWTTLTVEATTVWLKGTLVRTNRTRLMLQTDGDLVIIDEDETIRWRSNTSGRGDHAVFQDDGHLVVYDSGQNPLWSSGTVAHPGAVLVLAADGNVNIVDQGAIIWSSNTAH